MSVWGERGGCRYVCVVFVVVVGMGEGWFGGIGKTILFRSCITFLCLVLGN